MSYFFKCSAFASLSNFVSQKGIIVRIYLEELLLAKLINDIYEIRQILESFDKFDFHANSNFYHCSIGFPTGCCGDTTNLLGLYLKQRYDKNSEYISACGLGNKSNQSHVWLVCDGFIIDITADQFNAQGYDVARVIIAQESHFHTLFDRVDCHALNIESLNGTPVASVLGKVMRKISSNE